ncbi:MAG: 30S ribosomal protein S4 [Dehalococcoidia bacterium]|nr:30S ribosomal protein S4 [Dehalococcoidia bacterium]
MGRYTGPVCRLCRQQGGKLMLRNEQCLGAKCTADKRQGPPGVHSRRRKPSELGVQLREKQTARYTYGLMEKQFRNYFEEASRRPGRTGDTLLQLLERRLDNAVFRLGYADTRSQARQLVRHGHITINGHRANVPSQLVKSGDVLSWRGGSTKLEPYKSAAKDIQSKTVPAWLSLNLQDMSGRVLRLPERGDLETTINDRAIVEFYSR